MKFQSQTTHSSITTTSPSVYRKSILPFSVFFYYKESVIPELRKRLLISDTLRLLLKNPYFWVILIAFTIRLTTMGQYPIGDTTEARYSEIARLMVESGNWITPQYEYGVPFWGKPPLSIWLQATSFEVFGINEFSARLPTVFVSLLIVGLVFYLAKQQYGRKQAWIASTFLSTNALFFILSGAVMMDPLLTLGTTLSMLAFWQVMKDRGRYWGYLFYVGLSIGLMSKGPLAGVLTAMPIVIWLTISGNWNLFIQRIPLFTGTALMLALSLPWYLVAEQATPGFLNYYIIGEHWERFTTTGWQGNQFGSTHSSYAGSIWIDWLIAAFPMSFILIAALFTLINRKKSEALVILRDDWTLYLILWIVTLMIFFTFTGNTTITYVLPALPATALLVTKLWKIKSNEKNNANKKTRQSISVLGLIGIFIPLFFLTVIIFYIPKVADHNTEKFLIEKYHKLDITEQSRLIYFYDRPASAAYYSRGKAEVIKNMNEIFTIVNQESSVFLAVAVNQVKNIPPNLKQNLQKIDRFGRYVLFKKSYLQCI